jgi:release factor glutamine methyltransferase
VHNAEREARWLADASEDPSHLAELVRRRLEGEPLQYLTGVAGFRYLELKVGPGVLIPRPETEVVTQFAIDLLPRAGVLADVGTGSGAIALAVKHEREDARVLATEVSDDALAWARLNRDELGLDVELLRCDLLEGVPRDLAGALDVVVSNPPYVADEERRALPREVVEHEPEVALFAPGRGLGVIERLARDAREWLRPGGHLVLEIAPTHAPGMTALLGAYEDVSVYPDLTGRERVVVGRRE